jgi:hypothetical protein
VGGCFQGLQGRRATTGVSRGNTRRERLEDFRADRRNPSKSTPQTDSASRDTLHLSARSLRPDPTPSCEVRASRQEGRGLTGLAGEGADLVDAGVALLGLPAAAALREDETEGEGLV